MLPSAEIRCRLLRGPWRRPAECCCGHADWPVMSVFTGKELAYPARQRPGRNATVGPHGQPHVIPASFRDDPDLDAIEVGGLRMSQTNKLPDVQRTGRASIMIDDVLPTPLLFGQH